MRFAELLLPACVIAVIGSAIGLERISDRSEPPGRIHIAYWEKWTQFELDAMRAVVDDFNKSQDRIQVDLLSISDVGNKTMFAISAGVPPDVAGLWAENVPHYVDDRAVMPLDDFCKQAHLDSSYYIPAYWQLVTYKDHIWALPSTPASSALLINADVFQSVGLDPNKPPRTIEEMTAMADKLTIMKDGHLQRAGFLPAEPGDWNWAWGFYFGGQLWNGKDKITAATPENERGYDWVGSFSKKYGPGEEQAFKSGFGSFGSPRNAFVEGAVPMELQGPWAHNFVHRYAPNLHTVVTPFPYPADRPDLKDVSFVGADILVIPRGCKHPNEAFQFISFVQRHEEMEKLCLLQQKNCPLAEVSEHFYQTNENPDVRTFDRMARSKNAVVMPRMGLWAEYQSELNSAFDEVSLANKTGKQAMEDVQARMQPQLDEYLDRLQRREREGL